MILISLVALETKMASPSRTSEQIKNDIGKVKETLEKLYEEKSNLDGRSYSQSNPGAVMDRRFVRRDIESNERKLEKLKNELSSLQT